MNAREYALVLGAWLRLPAADILRVFSTLRRGGRMPADAREGLSAKEAACGLVSVLAASLEGGDPSPEACSEACGMALAAPSTADKDPLEGRERRLFCDLVGASLGTLSGNGYLVFAETIGQALEKWRENADSIELSKVSVRIRGMSPYGVVEAAAADGPVAWAFSPGGAALDKDGLYREATVDRVTLSGIAHVLSADGARFRTGGRTRPPRQPRRTSGARSEA